MLNTLKEFIDRVETLDEIHDAYYVFEEECTEYLRVCIYGFADADSTEPFRDAMHNLGFDAY